MKLIPLSTTNQAIKNKSKKYFAKVDDKDYEWLMKWKWFAHKSRNVVYAGRNSIYIKGEKRHAIKMHREILKCNRGDGKLVDHINHNGLDNQKSNLRIVTGSQNCMNSRKSKNKHSKYKGVTWHKRGKIWMSQIGANGKHYYLGEFKTEKEAAIAFNNKALELHGEFAHLNIIL